MLFKPVIGHNSYDLFIIRLIQTAVYIIFIRRWLTHVLMRFKCHLFGHLIDDGAFAKEICVDLGDYREFHMGAARGCDDSMATG